MAAQIQKTKLNTAQKALLLGIIFGLLIFGAYRFLSFQEPTHYHANFAVFINGERQEFDGPGFYESVTSCRSDETPSAAHRAHMHDGVNNVAHVHEEAVTWGMFFENIGYSVGKHHIATELQAYVDTDERQVRYVLNGEEVENIATTIIESEDQLLVSYDDPKTNLEKQVAAIDDTASKFNAEADPAACSGNDSVVILRLKNIYE